MQDVFIVFFVIVAPLWLVLHYRSKRHTSQQQSHQMSDSDYQQLQLLANRADKMAERIETLEKILDHEAPSWRTRV